MLTPVLCRKLLSSFSLSLFTIFAAQNNSMETAVFLGMICGYQWLLIIVALLLLFGGRKIPELMRGLGSGIKEFKDASKEDKDNKKVED